MPWYGPHQPAVSPTLLVAAFWKFLRPHTIRGTVLGTSAVRSGGRLVPVATTALARAVSPGASSDASFCHPGRLPRAVGEPGGHRLFAGAPGHPGPRGSAVRQRVHCRHQPGAHTASSDCQRLSIEHYHPWWPHPQIYDISIDKINKPFLPVASGEMSLKFAWIAVRLARGCCTVG